MHDEHAVTELKLYIDNDAALHRQQHVPIQKNLATKMVRSQYKHDLAAKLFGHLVEAGAKKYAKEFGGTWHQLFDVPTRKAVAEELTRDFEGEFALGNYDHLLPKKYQAEMLGAGGKKIFPSRHHSTRKASTGQKTKAKWIVPESLKVTWSPVNQAYFALWPGRGRVEDQQVLKIAGAEDMHGWLRDTYGESYGLASATRHHSRGPRGGSKKKSPSQLQREIDEALSKGTR